MQNLVSKFNNLDLSEMKQKISKLDKIEELNLLFDNLKISNKFNIVEKHKIFYWILYQSETINKKLFEREKLNVEYVY